MVEKTICDKCGKDIESDRDKFKLKIFNKWDSKTNADKDICKECLNKLGIWKIK